MVDKAQKRVFAEKTGDFRKTVQQTKQNDHKSSKLGQVEKQAGLQRVHLLPRQVPQAAQSQVSRPFRMNDHFFVYSLKYLLSIIVYQ